MSQTIYLAGVILFIIFLNAMFARFIGILVKTLSKAFSKVNQNLRKDYYNKIFKK